MIIISTKKENNFNAGHKAPEDILNICNQLDDIKEHSFLVKKEDNFLQKVLVNLDKIKMFKKLSKINENFIIQYPFSYQDAVNRSMINFMRKQKVVLVIHDIVGLRDKDQATLDKELNILRLAEAIIAHNQKMKKFLIDNGIKESKIYVLDLFDYICDGELQVDRNRVTNIEEAKVVYAGNLSKEKSPFLHQLEENKMKFNIDVFGVGIDEDINKNILFKGKLHPEELPNKLTGNLGLVWDGCFDESDENVTFKNYTKFNNPHKLSCYMAAGLPVIVWEKAAIADFVKKNNIGYTISNIYDINNLDLADYEIKLKNALEIKEKVRNGYFTKTVMKEIIKDIYSIER